MAEKYLTKSFFVTTSTGEKKQVKVRAKTKKELEKKFMEKKLGYEMGILTINSNTLFSKWADEWLETAIEDGIAINEPEDLQDYSGQFKLRIPKSLHKALAIRSKEEGISMNQYCLYLLSQNNAAYSKNK